MANLVIHTADELKASHPLERQVARRVARQQPLVPLILRTFLEQGGPVLLEDLIASSPDAQGDALHDALMALDDEDVNRADGRPGHHDR